MKLCRFQPLEIEWNAIIGVAPPQRPEPRHGVIRDDRVVQIAGDLYGMWYPLSQSWPRDNVRLLPPVTPSKIVCIGRNYREHAAELGNEVPIQPLIFLKPPSSVIGPEEPIVYPPESLRVDHEGELGVVIGRRCKGISAEEYARYVLGYTCVNDVTARDLQKADVQFTRGKGFDTFCPLGPLIETELDLATTTVETFVNGERKQHAPVTDMIFSIGAILAWISRVMTLEPGDVIATGTPAGVSAMKPGDVVEVVVSGIGTLRNPVVAADA
ncbi:MAG: fumarylacetoacetate hydrolase family protein [Acidobacteria bacterium]|nr:fumarylacetoacetate hydrolase family protein [Acidobacteriota bacterium]MCL5288038.1 fumarylacetoacetate hydrolase family protein [Acidobacteriota bacterium]